VSSDRMKEEAWAIQMASRHGAPVPAVRVSGAHDEQGGREPFGGKFFVIVNVEGDGDPTIIFRSKVGATKELQRRQSLGVDDDDRATEYHQIFPCDVAGCWWNSYDPDPRQDNPLSPIEIADEHGR
jgi:hypothetical protein